MCPVHEKKTNTRAASAGFIQLVPRPPKLHFTTSIANTAATAGMKSGTPGGIAIPINSPVSTALPSRSVIRPASAAATASDTAAAAMEVARTTNAPHPNT